MRRIETKVIPHANNQIKIECMSGYDLTINDNHSETHIVNKVNSISLISSELMKITICKEDYSEITLIVRSIDLIKYK